MQHPKGLFMGLAAALGLSACGHVDQYEEAVYDLEPTYCYQSLGKVQCYNEPNHRDQFRLVNYYGPHPSRFDVPEPRPAPALQAPPAVNYWVKDPEPIPRPMPTGELADRPWLTGEPSQARNGHMSTAAMNAFLRQAHDHLATRISETAGETNPELVRLPQGNAVRVAKEVEVMLPKPAQPEAFAPLGAAVPSAVVPEAPTPTLSVRASAPKRIITADDGAYLEPSVVDGLILGGFEPQPTGRPSGTN